VAAQSWLLDCVLRRQGRRLSEYDDLQARLAWVEQTLSRLGAAPPVAGAAAAPARARPARPHAASGTGRSAGPFAFRTVTLKNGVQFKVALDNRRGDWIADAVAAGASWFLDDVYVLLDLVQPGDGVLDLGGHIGTFALAAAALGCRVVCVEAAPENVALLNASVARNGFDRMHVVWGAATDHEGTLRFLPHGPWGTIANPDVERVPAIPHGTWPPRSAGSDTAATSSSQGAWYRRGPRSSNRSAWSTTWR
jgi:hypothetical protein